MEKNDRDFWQHHSIRFLEMALRTDRMGRLANPGGYGSRTGECGDTIELFVSVENGSISNVTIETNGCLNTVACANTVAQLAVGMSLEDAWEITAESVIEYLETLPPEETHCAELAVGAFYLALASLRETRQSPWRKLYQNP